MNWNMWLLLNHHYSYTIVANVLLIVSYDYFFINIYNISESELMVIIVLLLIIELKYHVENYF